MSQALATTGARFTERSIQDALYLFCSRKRHRFMVPNVQMFGWESDLISVTKDDFVYEYEIKISRKDFRQDLLKDRHQRLASLQHAPVPGWWHDSNRKGANYLYYAAPAGILAVDDIPVHAGLILISDSGVADIRGRAPKLHKSKLLDHHRQWLERSLTCRYWNARLKQEPAKGTNAKDPCE
jgi:hypothetical protein